MKKSNFPHLFAPSRSQVLAQGEWEGPSKMQYSASDRAAGMEVVSVVDFYAMLRFALAFAFISSSAIISFMLTGLLAFAVFFFA